MHGQSLINNDNTKSGINVLDLVNTETTRAGWVDG